MFKNTILFERHKFKCSLGITCFGNYRFRYKSQKGEISLIALNKNLYNNSKVNFEYEILCIEGNLFYDIMTFDTREEAENQIFKYLK